MENMARRRAQPDGAAATTSACAGRHETAIPARTILLVLVASVLMLVIKPAWNRPAAPGAEITESFYSIDEKQIQAHTIDASVHDLHTTFVMSTFDEGTQTFLSECRSASATRWGRVMLHGRHQAYLVVQRVLGWSHTDAAGYLGHVKLFPASEEQLRRALMSKQQHTTPTSVEGTTMLDIGAGEGTVTETLAAALGVEKPSRVWTIETSAPHQQSLAQRGFHSVGSFDDLPPTSAFDVVTLLHVLDRCEQPLALLELTAERVAPGGLLIVATPLPFCAKVWSGRFGRVLASRPPDAPLQLSPHAVCDAKPTFEVSVSSFAASVLAPLRDIGLQIESWTRLPYLFCGTARTHHALDSVLFVLRREG
jgi:SAM-dependent methyltransferase